MKSEILHCILLCIIIILLLVFLLVNSQHNEEHYIDVTTVAKGTVQSVKDLSSYAQEKWIQLKDYLRNHYREALIRKLFKFLHNSRLTYLGREQDPKKDSTIRKRKFITQPGEPTLLQMLCAKVKSNPTSARTWLINVLRLNMDDYLYEQWKLKNPMYRMVLSLGENFKFLTGEQILDKYLIELLMNEEDYADIRRQLKEFVRDGIRVCDDKLTAKGVFNYIKKLL